MLRSTIVYQATSMIKQTRVKYKERATEWTIFDTLILSPISMSVHKIIDCMNLSATRYSSRGLIALLYFKYINLTKGAAELNSRATYKEVYR